MATCAVSGNILDPSGTAMTSLAVSARINQGTLSGTSLIMPLAISTTTNSSGNWTLTVQQSLSVIFTVQYPPVGTEPMRVENYTANIPAATSAQFSSIIVVE
jgi:hypothetical protein